MSGTGLPWVKVQTKDGAIAYGALFCRTDWAVVLLNNVLANADLGEPKCAVHDFVENETDAMLIPSVVVESIWKAKQ